MCGPDALKHLSDVERVQFLSVKVIMKRRLEQGDSIEQAFATAISLTSNDNVKFINPELLDRYLKEYYLPRKNKTNERKDNSW